MLWWVGLGAGGCRVRRRGFGRSPRGQQAKRVGGGGRVARASRARVIAASGERHRAERSNPLHGFGIDCSVEEIGRDFRPFGTPPRGLLVGVQFRQCGDHVRPAVEEVAQHP